MGTVLVAMRHDMGGLNNGPRSKGNSFVFGLVWLGALGLQCVFSGLCMKDQMKSICKIFSETSVIFNDESNDGN